MLVVLIEVISRYSTRLIAFYDGRVLADGPTAKVMQDDKVQELVTGHHLEINYPKEVAHA